MYTQNGTDTMYLTDNVILNNMAFGNQLYSELARLQSFTMESNFSFINGSRASAAVDVSAVLQSGDSYERNVENVFGPALLTGRTAYPPE